MLFPGYESVAAPLRMPLPRHALHSLPRPLALQPEDVHWSWRPASAGTCQERRMTCQRPAVLQELIRGPDRLQAVMALRATSVPPQLFFWLLILAGFGVPVSEDLLCIYAGVILRKLSPQRRVEVVVALYAGVVLSDWVTYSLGRLAGNTLLSLTTSNKAKQPSKRSKQPKLSRLERAQTLFAKSGPSVGFALRLAPGLRVPLLLLSGLSKVQFWTTFVPYNLLGALVSVSVQLAIGAISGASPAMLQGSRVGLVFPAAGILLFVTLVSLASLKQRA
mmetsp:Transcript_68018/g.127025  ORF Transcript_68018/g.127025 Transcript_68018/m.127025 type:complete len:277 (-) Transcript_68018:79-909(-)